TAQQGEINAIEAGAGLETDGTYVAPTGSNYLGAATSLKNADFILDAGIKTQADAINTINTVTIPALQGQINDEVVRATAAEAAEVTARTNAVNAVASDLSDEVTRATGIENGLRTDLDQEVTDRTNAVTAANNAIGAETTRATGVEDGLDSRISALEANS